MKKIFISLTSIVAPSLCYADEKNFEVELLKVAHGNLSNYEFYLSMGVLLFGLIILGLQVGLLYKLKSGWGPNSVRMAGLTLVIISGIFLITAGYSQDQIAPMITLLGTIAGYLLAKSEKKE